LLNTKTHYALHLQASSNKYTVIAMTKTLQSKNTISEETETEKQCMKTQKD